MIAVGPCYLRPPFESRIIRVELNDVLLSVKTSRRREASSRGRWKKENDVGKRKRDRKKGNGGREAAQGGETARILSTRGIYYP